MQPREAFKAGWPVALFQSSPALKDRCNEELVAACLVAAMFQSSPALKDRCNSPRLVASATRAEFQSSPALKDRCNPANGRPAVGRVSFNPHRPRKTGATFLNGRPDNDYIVSILTGLERPVQRVRAKLLQSCFRVSILTGLERPVQRIWTRRSWSRGRLWFQSSPALKDRCNHVWRPSFSLPDNVSILTGLERPVQPGAGDSSG